MDAAAIRTAIKDRLNYTSSTTDTRLLNSIQRIYREVGTSIGMSFARQTNTSIVVTIANADVTFTATEKVLQVWYLTGSVPMILDEILNTEMRERVIPSSDKPTQWALVSTASNTVKIRLNAKPKTAYTLYADVIQEISDLAATDEPTFPESFHDIIIEGVLRDEYRKQEKLALSRDSEQTYQRRLSDLRMFMAKSAYLNIQQGKYTNNQTSSGAGGGSASQTVTGAASSTDNAIARWNGTGGTSIQNSGITVDDSNNVAIPANASITMATGTGIVTIPNSGLHVFDTDASHDLIITPGSNLTVDRILTLTTGDAARTVTISGDTTISQDYSTAGSPQFTGVELGHATDTTLTRVSAGVIAVEGTNLAKVSDNLSVFAATTSAQLAGVISDETGSGLLVFGTSPTLAGTVAGTPTFSGAVAFSGMSNTGLKILDSDASHALTISTGSNLTAAQTLTLNPGDATRTVTISGNTTISQDYSTAGSPQFTGIELGHATDTTITRVSAGLVAIEGVNVVTTSSTQTLTNKSIDLATNTVTGTTAQFNTALTDGNFVTLAGTETLTNKTITAPTIDGTNVNIGGGASATELRLLEPSGSGTNYIAFKSPALAANVTYTLPIDDGTSGDFLQTDGSGGLSWTVTAFAPSTHWSTAFEDTARFISTVVSGGTTGVGNTGGFVNTSATGTSSAKLECAMIQANNNGGVFTTFTAEFGIGVTVSVLGTDFQSFHGLGIITVDGSSVTYTSSHIGFKLVRSASGSTSLFATQADGTTETASSALTTVVLDDFLELSIRLTSSSSISYYWRKNGSAWSSATTLTTNIPTTATVGRMGSAVSNVATATRTQIEHAYAYYER